MTHEVRFSPDALDDGLGMSIAPVRFGVPPEIVVVDPSSEAVS